jgi:hypothetical protein
VGDRTGATILPSIDLRVHDLSPDLATIEDSHSEVEDTNQTFSFGSAKARSGRRGKMDVAKRPHAAPRAALVVPITIACSGLDCPLVAGRSATIAAAIGDLDSRSQ